MTPVPPCGADLQGVVLAAGGSRRLGRRKQLVMVDGVPLVRRTVQIVREACGTPVIVVTGCDAGRVADCVSDLEVLIAHNPNWESGLGGSLATGLEALTSDRRAALVTPCDLPRLSVEDLRKLAAAWRRSAERPAACRYDGVLGTPAILPTALFSTILQSAGETGAAEYLRQPGIAVTAVDMPAAALDLDRQQDLENLEADATLSRHS